jgi:phage major head subunit gpT-like protein
MIINAENLANMYIGFNAAFNNAFAGAPSFRDQLAMVVPSSTRTNDYKFLLQFPMLREWVGDRVIKSLAAESFQITNKSFEATVEVDRDDIEDDQLGIFSPMVAELAKSAKQHPDILIAALMAAGLAVACYDGKMFFAADHPMPTPDNPAAAGSNTGGGAGTAWYLLDTSRAIKPFIFQSRKPAQLVSQDRPEDEHNFMHKKFRYGVDYRGNVGYGLWQLAYTSKDTLNATNYATARAAMMAYHNDEGVPLGIIPNLVVVPPSLEAAGKALLENQYVAVAGAGMQDNVWKGTAKLLVVPWLT